MNATRADKKIGKLNEKAAVYAEKRATAGLNVRRARKMDRRGASVQKRIGKVASRVPSST